MSTRKRRATFVSSGHKRSCPIARKGPQDFWVAQEKAIPCYDNSPWQFYEFFGRFRSGPELVFCNANGEIRVLTCYVVTSDGSGFRFPHVKHQNFVDIYETYQFEDRLFAISEYLNISLEDLIQHSIYPTEPEIAFIISQVLAGIRFIWSRKLDHQLISIQNIRLSQGGIVKIDSTIQPEHGDQTSANANSLGTIMLELMREKRETLTSTASDVWLDEAINFVEACSTSTPDELSDHVFMTCLCSSGILKPLCFMGNIAIHKAFNVEGPFSARFQALEA